MSKPEPTAETLENALWFPEDYHWGPSETVIRATQGGGTCRWDQDQDDYVFVTPPEWWTECKPGDTVPSEWGVL